MKTAALNFLIALLIACLPFAVFAAESGVSQTEFQAYKKVVQDKLDETKDSLPAKVKERMDERVGDLAHHLTILSIVIGAFGVLLTVVGLVGWVSVKDRASNEVRDWIEKKGNETLAELLKQKEQAFDDDLKQRIDNKLKEFESQLENMKKAVAQKQNEVLGDIDQLATHAKQAIEMKQQQFSTLESNTDPLLLGDKAISELAERLKHKPESEYTFDDWNTRAFDAVEAGLFDDAIYHWRASINVKDATKKQTAQSLYNTGVALGRSNRSEEAIAVYDEVVKRFGEASEPAVREQVAMALFNKGVTLRHINRSEEAIAVYDEVVKRFGEANEPALREQVAKALVNKGYTLGQLNRSEEEIAVYDEVIKRFGEASEPAVREQVATALVNKGITLGQLNRSEEEIAVYDEVIKRFGKASEPAVREQVATALVNKGITLGELNRSEEEIAVYDEVLRRFGEVSEPALRERVARALVNKGVTLGQINRSEEEIAVYDEVVKRFGEANEPALREQVAVARNGKGFTLFCRAKEHWQDEAARIGDLQTALVLFKQAEGDMPSVDKPMVWGNQVYSHFLLGQIEPVRALLQQALQQGGEELYQATLEDLAIHPVPPDADFRSLLDEVWAEVQANER